MTFKCYMYFAADNELKQCLRIHVAKYLYHLSICRYFFDYSLQFRL